MYAEKILNGEKKFEYRKKLCKKDIKKIFDAKMNMFDMNNDPYWTDISIDTDFVDDSDRCGDEWQETHYVKAYSPMDDVWHVIGMCNFYE